MMKSARKISVILGCFLVLVFASAPIAVAASTGFPMYSWGIGVQLGHGDTITRDTPTRIGTASNWIQAASASGTSIAINTEGHLYTWGNDWDAPNMGQGDNPAGSGSITAPIRVGTGDSWTWVAARGSNAAGISAGNLYVWGATIGAGNNVPTLVPGPANTEWELVSMQTSVVLVICTEGNLYSFGTSNSTVLGRDGSGATPYYELGRIASPSTPGAYWVDVVLGNGAAKALSSTGHLYTWGSNGVNQLGRDTSTTPATVPGRVGADMQWTSIAATSNGAVAAIAADGHLYTWGSAALGQQGRGYENPPVNVATPTRVGTANNWEMVLSANSHFVAVNSDNSLYAWGNNLHGQLGIGETGGYRYYPTYVFTAEGFSGASRGGGHLSLMLLRTPSAVVEDLDLTKNLQVPEGTTLPESGKTFEFVFVSYSFNGDVAYVAEVPSVASAFITIDNTATATTVEGTTTKTASIDAFYGAEFARAGTFAFLVNEVEGSSETATPTVMTYSPALYEVRIQVGETTTPAGTTAFEIVGITVIPRVVDNAAQTQGVALEDSELIFTNILEVGCPCETGTCTCQEDGPCTCGNQDCPCGQNGGGDICEECDENPCVCDLGTEETTPTAPGNNDNEVNRQPGKGPETGDASNSFMHVLHMVVALAVVVVVMYRFTCPSEAIASRKAG